MSMSRNTGSSETDTPLRTLLDGLLSLSRYDVLLGLVPLGFVVSLLGHVLLAVSFHEAVLLGGAFGTVLLFDAMFLHPPARSSRRRYRS